MNRIGPRWFALLAASLALTLVAATQSPNFKPAQPNAALGRTAQGRRA